MTTHNFGPSLIQSPNVDFSIPYYDLVGISILMKKPKVRRDHAHEIILLILGVDFISILRRNLR
jgi:hypothetical protein